MRPPRVDSNLYAYHLTKLLKNGYLTKDGKNYSLAPKGLACVDRLSFSGEWSKQQPVICTGIILKNEYDEVLLTKRLRQPFLGKWWLPMGKLEEADRSIHDAAHRELFEKTGVRVRSIRHIGDCYLRLTDNGYSVLSAFAHIFTAEVPKAAIELGDDMSWRRVDRFGGANDFAGMDEIVRLSEGRRGRFFAEIRKTL
jgi:8-oxo-dGTP pyrophosphatase MutT (NUDIX family)